MRLQALRLKDDCDILTTSFRSKNSLASGSYSSAMRYFDSSLVWKVALQGLKTVSRIVEFSEPRAWSDLLATYLQAWKYLVDIDWCIEATLLSMNVFRPGSNECDSSKVKACRKYAGVHAAREASASPRKGRLDPTAIFIAHLTCIHNLERNICRSQIDVIPISTRRAFME
jgi:hypothetical protein